jgi:sugar transferase (PEP-CTERM/EpsH1 system associated)
MNRKQILILSTRAPYPLIGGDRIRIFGFAELLARSYAVTLIVLNEGPLASEAAKAMQDAGIRTESFEFSPVRFRLNAVRGLLSPLPLQAHYYYFRRVQRWIDKHLDEFDLVICNHIRSAAYVQARDIPKIIDLHDAISLNYERARTYAPPFWRWIYGIERSRVLRQELSAIATFDKALIISPVDKAFLASNGANPEKMEVLPIAVGNSLLNAREATENPTIVFVGRMNTVANADAAIYFAREVFPLLHGKFPNLEFQVVGAEPNSAVQSLQELEGVTVTGRVPEYVPHLLRASVVVDPMRFGAGMQNKILEAMALGKAVVASPLAVEGIGGMPGVHYLTGESAQDLADRVEQLLLDASLRKSLGDAAREFVRQHFTWEVVGKSLLSIVDGVLKDPT